MNRLTLLLLLLVTVLTQNQQIPAIQSAEQQIGEHLLKSGDYRVEFVAAHLPSFKQLRFRGCNINTLAYKIQSGSITFSQARSTRKFCAGDQDPSYVQEIKKVKKIESVGNELIFKNSEGKEIMRVQKLTR